MTVSLSSAVAEIVERKEFDSLDTVQKRVLSRWSIFDLREISEDAMRRGEARELGAVVVTASGTGPNFIEWFQVESDGSVYELRRFMTFHYCSCPHYFYNKSACKHIVAITVPACARCGKNVSVRGSKCSGCSMDTAIYNKASLPTEKIGGIRI